VISQPTKQHIWFYVFTHERCHPSWVCCVGAFFPRFFTIHFARISPSSGTSDGCVFVWGSALGPEAPARRFAADPFLVLPLAFHGTSAAT
jgi:hypothetical protein